MRKRKNCFAIRRCRLPAISTVDCPSNLRWTVPRREAQRASSPGGICSPGGEEDLARVSPNLSSTIPGGLANSRFLPDCLRSHSGYCRSRHVSLDTNLYFRCREFRNSGSDRYFHLDNLYLGGFSHESDSLAPQLTQNLKYEASNEKETKLTPVRCAICVCSATNNIASYKDEDCLLRRPIVPIRQRVIECGR